MALAGGAEIIDCKDPARGALGALEIDEIRDIVLAVAGRVPVSATVGDIKECLDDLLEAVAATAATGVDVVKVGFYGTEIDSVLARALATARVGGARLFGVLMADRVSDFALLGDLSRAGFIGAMLDTVEKGRGSLTGIMDHGRLTQFLGEARGRGLVAGLAGSLRISDIAPLSAIRPDILGFRGALCAGGRNGPLEGARVGDIRRALDGAAGPVADDARRRVPA